MSAQELLRYINLFREKAELGKLVIFVGAGVSRNVEGMPSWNELIQQFYQSIIEGYGFADEGGCSVDVSCLHTDQRVAYLHNSAVIECLRTRKFDSSKVKRFIGNMALSKERDMYSDYLDMYNGNAKKMGKMQIALEELKEDVCNRGTVRLGHMSHSKLIEIKRQVISEYLNASIYCT